MDYYNQALSQFRDTNIKSEIQYMYNNLPENKKNQFINCLFIKSNYILKVDTIENIRICYKNLMDPMDDITNSFRKVRVAGIFDRGGKKSRKVKRKFRRVKRKSKKSKK